MFNNQASLLESVEEISQVRVSPGSGGGGSCAVLAPLLHSTTNSTSGFGRFNLSTWGVLRGKRKSELLKSKVILQRQQPAGKHFAKMFEVISDGQCDGEIVRIMQ